MEHTCTPQGSACQACTEVKKEMIDTIKSTLAEDPLSFIFIAITKKVGTKFSSAQLVAGNPADLSQALAAGMNRDELIEHIVMGAVMKDAIPLGTLNKREKPKDDNSFFNFQTKGGDA